MAHRYEATGCDGLPVIRLDKLYRVPRWAFAVLVLTGRVVTLAELEAHGQQVGEQVSGQAAASPTPAVVEPDSGTSFALVWQAGCRSRPPFVRSSSRRFGGAAAAVSRRTEVKSCPLSLSSVRSGSADRCPYGRDIGCGV